MGKAAAVRLALLAAISTQLSLATFLGRVNEFDEGYALYAAMRILDGQVPFRDFWVVYPPGEFYSLALLFRLFGPSLLVERVFETLVRLLLLALGVGLSSRLFPRGRPLVTAALIALTLAAFGSYFAGYSMFPALVLSLAAFLALERYGTDGRRSRLVGSGTLLGMTAIFRHDLAVYLAVGLCATLMIRVVLERADGGLGRVAQEVLILGGSSLVLPAVVALLLFVAGALPQAWTDLVTFPLTTLERTRNLPLPPLLPNPWNLEAFEYLNRPFWQFILILWLPFYIPVVTYTTAAIGLLRGRPWERRSVPGSATVAMRAGLVLYGLLLFRTALTRVDEIHLVPTLVITSVLLGGTPRLHWARWLAPLRASARVLRGVGVGLYVVFLAVALGDALDNFAVTLRNCQPAVARAWCYRLSPSQVAAITYVGATTSAGEPIFVGGTRTDRVWTNDIIFYFLADRHTPSRYFDLAPGVATTLPVQAEIVASLQRTGVRTIVRRETPLPDEPNESSNSSGVTLLDDYIAEAFKQTAAFGPYQIWTRARDQ